MPGWSFGYRSIGKPAMKHIIKIGLAHLRNDEILLVRKRGSKYFILPGGKPEVGESDVAALGREIFEELGCALDMPTVKHIGTFSDRAAGTIDTQVTIRLYAGEIIGAPAPRSEIEGLAWISLENHPGVILAPSLQNSILPSLAEKRREQLLCV